MKRLWLFLVPLLALSAGCRNEPVRSPGEEVIRIKTVMVIPGMVSIPVHATGILAASEDMKLSFKAGGIVAKVKVREGDRVRKDDILAELNLSEIKANVEIATSAYEKALRDYTRANNLYADTVATLEQLQNAKTALNVAESNLEIAKFNLGHSTIRAPGSGIILKQLARENELVAAGYPVFLFGISDGGWKVKTGLSDRDLVKVNIGDSAVIRFDAYPGVSFRGEVEQISGIADPMTGTYQTDIRLNGQGYRLAAGFIASADIFPAKNMTVMKIPVGAIVDAEGSSGYIYVLNEDSRVSKTAITIISISGPDASISGLPSGSSEIVSEGAAYLKDGVRVEVVK